MNLLNSSDGTDNKFITSAITDLFEDYGENDSSLILALAMLDLPLSIDTMSEYPHTFESD